MRRNRGLKATTRSFLTFLVAVVLSVAFSAAAYAQGPAIDPAATQILQRMTDYLGGLEKFSAHTQNTIEDQLDSGHRIDIDVSARFTISRPNKLHAERTGEVIDQEFYYDGKTLTLYNPSDKVYATVPAPGTIEETITFVGEAHGVLLPASDLIRRNVYPLLMQDVTLGAVVGKAVVNGVKCDHLIFSRPGVDFQVWVQDSGDPLPLKYVVTDTGTPALLSIVTVMSDWNVTPAAEDAQFAFEPPQDAKPITFLSVE